MNDFVQIGGAIINLNHVSRVYMEHGGLYVLISDTSKDKIFLNDQKEIDAVWEYFSSLVIHKII